MGIFSYLRKGGNFGIIAETATNWYCGVREHPLGGGLTKKQQLYATAMLDCSTYLRLGQMGFSDIFDIMDGAYQPSSLAAAGGDELLSFLFSLETVIFKTEHPEMDLGGIVRAVMEKRDKIAERMKYVLRHQTMEQKMMTIPGVSNLLGDPDFLEDAKALYD